MAELGQRPDIERKVELIADRIVRGKFAKNNKSVQWFRIHRAATLVASTLTSAGLAHPFLSLFSEQGQKPTNQWC